MKKLGHYIIAALATLLVGASIGCFVTASAITSAATTENVVLTRDIFTDESNFVLDLESSVTLSLADLAEMPLGTVVKTADFNGVLVAEATPETYLDAAKNIPDAFQNFILNNPELNFMFAGQTKARVINKQYVFLVFVDKTGFDLRSEEFRTPEAIQSGFARQEAAIAEILENVTSDDPVTEIKELNRLLTTRNGYNTHTDLSAESIGASPRTALCALEGHFGLEGPVCVGYSTAFKVLCDRLGIPCQSISGTNHMWNIVQVSGIWYGIDVTWNDPLTANADEGSLSGRENASYLLVGSEAVIDGLKFSETHQSSYGGVNLSCLSFAK